MKKFIIYLLVIVLTVSLSFAVFYLVRNDEVITISTSSMYVDKGDPFTIDVTDQNKKEYTDVTINISNEDVVKYDETKKEFIAVSGGFSRINFKTNNVKFRNLSCDVIVGDGTITSPYYISTAEQLASIGMGEQLKDENENLLNVYAGKAPYTKYASDKYYKLIDNIDVSSINGGYWIPLRAFSGSLDGNGLTISKVSIDIENHKALNDGKSGLFGSTNVGFFSEILPSGIVYNLKFDNFGATGSYTNFGCVAGVNRGTIERVEVKDAFLSVESDVFGGITAINSSREVGENDTYTRDIARIECSNVNLLLGRKYATNSTELVTYGVTGIVGGIVGINNGGTVAYSYSTGDIYFGADGEDESITYGGLIGENNCLQMEKIGGAYTQYYQGGNIKDGYSSINTHLKKAPYSTSLFGGVIGKNTDVSLGNYDDDENVLRVSSYFAGVRYDKETLNFDDKIENYTKNFKAVASNLIDGEEKTFVEKDITICGLNGAELKNKNNFISYKTQEDEEGKLLEETKNVLWAFGTIWGIDDKVNNGMPYLNYTVVTIADDFRYVGIPVMDNDVYKFAFDTSQPIVIVSGQNGYLELKLNETYNLAVSPYEAMADITWSSSDSSIVAVDSNGKITALNGGIVTITAESKSGFVDSIRVRVIVDDVYYVENIQSEINLCVGDTYQFENYKIYVNGNVVTNKQLSYYSDSDVISVTAAGKVTANTPGSTTIEISIGNFTKTVNVNVYSKEDDTNKVVDVIFKETNFYYTYSGTQIDGNIIITSAICNSTDIKDSLLFGFETENEMVEVYYNSTAPVTDGIAIPFRVKGAGRCVITCVVKTEGYYSNATDIIIVSELEEQEEELILDTYSVKLLEGVTKQLVASGFSNKTVTWKSANSAIATVDKYGLVTAVSEGSTTITATITLNDGSKLVKSCSVTVVGEDKYINYTATINGTSAGKNLTMYEMYQNEEITIKAESNYKFGTNENFSWTIKKESYIEVISKSGTNDNTIKIKAELVGKVPITISAGSKTSTTLYIKILKAQTTEDDGDGDTVVEPSTPTTPAYNKYITNVNQLNAVRYYLDKDFVLIKSIDLSDVSWEPIAWKSGEYFTGSFTVNYSCAISNMTISGDYNNVHALFGQVKNATIENVIIDNAKVTTGCYGAGVVAYATGNTTITNCSVRSSKFHATKSNSAMGGIIGTASFSTNITISGCLSLDNEFTISSGCYASIGGIAGNSASLIKNSSTRGTTISANYNSNTTYVGGIVGNNTGKIKECTVGSSTIVGYYAGGIAGYLNASAKSKVYFSEYSKGYRKEDVSSSDYTDAISICGVDSHSTVKGVMVGGLVGTISNGAVVNSYTRATLEGVNSSSILGGFTAQLMSDANFGRKGGYGSVGIIDTCYSACNFKGSGKYYSSTSTDNVHKYNYFGGDDVARNAGYMFNYLVESKTGVTNLSCSGLKDYIKSVKSSTEMTNKQTYVDKGFSSTIWLFGTGYPMLNGLNYYLYN